jgi:THAP4-like, heme-binding beta-barrel domain
VAGGNVCGQGTSVGRVDLDTELHPDVAGLACLLGQWAGEGQGEYPTIQPFRYREEVTFGHVGKPFLAYRQATVNLATGLPAHAEVGYLRGVGDGRVELILAHPTGIAEVTEGTVETQPDGGLRLHLRSRTVAGSGTAKEVRSLERTVEVRGDVLRYDLAMGAVGQPHQHHLRAELHRA